MPRVTKLTPADILDGAADAIETYGLTKNDLGDVSRGFCVVGAINFAAYGDPLGMIAHGDDPPAKLVAANNTARRAVRERVSDNPNDLFVILTWNNDPERTQDEVVTTLRDVAADLRKEIE